MPARNLMTTKEAARYLKLHYVTLYKLAQQGRIPASKIGGSWRFSKNLLDDWLARQVVMLEGSVLIVDNDPSALEAITEAASQKGFRVLSVDNCEKAVEELRRQQFELIFLDPELPCMNEAKLLETVTAKGGNSAVLITRKYSGNATPADASAAEQVRLIRKPFTVREIVEAIESVEQSRTAKARGEGRENLAISQFLGSSQHSATGHLSGAVLEETVGQGEARFREMLELLPEIVYEANADGRLTYVNRAGFETFGYTREDFEAGLNVLQVLTPEERERAAGNIQKLLAGRDPGLTEYTAQRKDGSRFPIIVHARPVTSGTGDVTGFRGVLMNLSEASQIEEMLWESEEELRIIFDSIGDAIYIADLDGNITDANEAALRQGRCRNRDEVIGHSAFEFIAQSDRDRAQAELKSALAAGRTKEKAEFTLVRPDGSQYCAELSVSLLRDSYGNPKGLIGAVRDVTQRRQAEEEARRTEERVRAYIDSAPHAIYIHDPQGNFLYGNSKAEELIGYSREELIGKNLLQAGLLTDGYAKKLSQRVEQEGRFAPQQPTEIELIRKDGTHIIVEITAFPMALDGKLEVIGLARDITERKRKVQDTEGFAEAATGELKATLSLLSSCKQLLSQRYESELDTDAEEFLQYATEDVRRLQQRISQLLEPQPDDSGDSPSRT